MTWTARQQVEITGHNRETRGVVHYLRPIMKPGQQVELHGGLIITDEKTVIEDGTIMDVSITVTEAAPTPG